MGDLIQVEGRDSKHSKKEAAAKPSIKDILRADKDVRDFYKLISDFNMREKAIDLMTSRMDRSKIV